ncbi:hypothetical protein TNCV_1341371 [Trichonephila clavipes]|uniref:Uncharacterized protein n=1 Tax=Trichonephila clavipes TaxID=2585209 RepID=A0A8X6VA46_TRICX|nr:hypothetical protein TNCV_1341371 [Trichonephila clavipes]
MEDDKVFALNLSLYLGADLGDFINFMVLLRSHVNTLKPSEIIALGSTVDLVEKIRQLFPHLDLQDFPSLEPYAYLEPADLFHDYLEQEARKGKGAFIQAMWTVIGKPKLYNLVTKAWTEQGPQTLAPWIQLAQLALDGCYGQKWPIPCLKCPMHVPSASLLYTSKKEHSVDMCFTKSVFYNTWTLATPVPSAEHC